MEQMKTQQEPEKENGQHSPIGHRKRLKKKVRENGLQVLSEDEVLELLLTYTIPQKDTKPIAYRLLNVYGNINNVINANFKDLVKQKGVGDETALFFKVLEEFFEIYRKNLNKDKALFLRHTNECVNYFRLMHTVNSKECLYIVCTNNMNKFVKEIEIGGYNDTGIKFEVKDIAAQIMDKGITNLVLFHTHPAGSVRPSMEDIDATRQILQICCLLNVNLCDHIILNEFEHYSMGTNGELLNLYAECHKQFPTNGNIVKMMQNKMFIQRPPNENK